jgi:sec-independent protein translocase protein TatA
VIIAAAFSFSRVNAGGLIAMWGFGPSHMLIVAVIALLLFGDRLPEVMRSLGAAMVEFKKGMRGIENAIESAATSAATRRNLSYDETAEHEEVSTPRFQPPTSEPRAESSDTTPSNDEQAPDATDQSEVGHQS